MTNYREHFGSPVAASGTARTCNAALDDAIFAAKTEIFFRILGFYERVSEIDANPDRGSGMTLLQKIYDALPN